MDEKLDKLLRLFGSPVDGFGIPIDGEALAALRAAWENRDHCLHCGVQMEMTANSRNTRRYCSGRCRVAAYRKRNR